MTKARKLVALMLAFLMIFSSASVFASAMSDSVDSGTALNISTKFFKEVDGTWTETTKVRPNDVVKARVYLETDYYSGDSTLLFFYDKDFFTHSYAGQAALEMNTDPESFAATSGVSGFLTADSNLQSQVDAGYITSAQLDEYGVLAASVEISGTETVKYDGSDWLFEITLTVAADASGEGDLFTVEELFQSTTRTKALGDVPKGEQGGDANEAWPMWVWDADITLASQPVSTISSVTFNANGGTFADGNATFGPIEGTIDSAIAADALPANPNYEGYTFLGWVDAEIENPTEADIVAAPSEIPEKDLVLNAYWIKNVNITFADTGDTTIDPITNVTPNTEFKEIADPKKEGHTFVGWDVRGGKLPDVYPTVDTTYTAIWATNVTVSFDTDGGTEIAPVSGYDGAPFEATITEPQKEGHYFVGWVIDGGDGKLVELPTVFPRTDVTYNAIYDTYTYYVTYIVKNLDTGDVKTYYLQAEYGSEVGFPIVSVPEGYEMDTQWYTDEACSVPFAAGTTMGTAPLTLYTTIDVKSYKAYFMLEEGDDVAEAYEVLDATYGEEIPVPANDPTKEGFTFAGWTPYVGILDVEDDVIFYATWEEEIHNVTYYMNDDTTDIHEAYDVPYGYDLEIPADPTREGYTFIGWNTDSAATTALAIEGTKMPNDSVEYYAVWEINEYKVTFDSNEGTAVEDKTQEYKSSVTAPTEPTREGYKFVAWNDADGNAVTFPFEMPAHDVALTAEWKLESYTLHFAETGDSTIDDKVVSYGDTIDAVADPEKEGYKFLSWSPEVPTEIGDLGNDGDTITYTAQWKQEEYTIRYADTGDSTIEDKVVKMGDTIEIPAGLTKDGQGVYFDGWDVTPPTTIVDMGNDGDVFTYTAQWTNESYVLQFADTNDAGDVITENVTYGDDFTAPTGLTKTGHVFAGWDETPPTKIEDMGDNGAVITYTAQWTAETYVFHFTNTGDTAVADATVTYGQDYTAPTGLTKTGHTFAGWDVTPPTEITDLGEDKAVLTYTAQWDKITYTVTWNDESGTSTTEVVYGDAIVAPTAATKEGYYFVKWTPDVPATMPADENLVFTALYEVSVYNVNYYVNGEFAVGYSAEFGEVIRTENTGYTTPVGYVFDGWYTDADCTTKLAEGATVGADVVNLYAKVTAGTFTANFYLDDAKTDLYYTTDVVFDKEIRLPDDLEAPAKEGYVFAGWTPYVGLMDTEGKDFVAVWEEKSDITATYYVDGEVYDQFTDLVYGADMEIPGDPHKEGYRFDGWAVKGTTEIVELQGTKVPAASVEYEAIFTITAFTVTYYNYESSEYGPEGTPAPGYEAYTIDGAAVTGTYEYQDAIAHPAAPVVVVVRDDGVEHTDYYVFTGWEDADGNVWADGAAMPANHLDLYAKYERVAVQLVAQDGSTTVVERGTDTTAYSDYYLSGFTGSRLTLSQSTLDSRFVDIQGDGYFTVTPAEGNTRIGTGAIVTVFDNVTGAEVERFYIVYYGDINGDGRVTTADSSQLETELLNPVWSKRGSQVGYLVKAADLDGNRRIATADSARLENVLLGTYTIDQVTGIAS